MLTELFMYFCIKNYIGTQGEAFNPDTHPHPHPEVYTADRSKAQVPMFFLFCVAM